MGIASGGQPQPKGKTRKQLKARKQRHAAKVVTSVRARCVERDGHCRISNPMPGDQISRSLAEEHVCSGRSEWSHLGEFRRFKTRGMEPEVRHDTKHSAMLCDYGHLAYDCRWIRITYLTRNGADGPLSIRRLG